MKKEEELLRRAATILDTALVHQDGFIATDARMWLEDFEEWKKEKEEKEAEIHPYPLDERAR